MVTTEPHQSQDLTVPHQNQDLTVPHQSQDLTVPHQSQDQEEPASPPSAAFDLDKFSQGPVNAITVLTLLDKLVNMLDAVQENQHKMELHQVEMESVVKGIQADMTKLAKSHTHTANTVSKLLDKSRKLSVTMKEVRERMERQGAQVKKLEANHAHLISRNNFKVLIFQEENEIPTTVFVKSPPPFPRDDNMEEDEPPAPGVSDGKQEPTFKTIDLSSDEDVGLEADLEEEDMWPQDLEHLDQSKAEKLKRSSMKRVDSLKKAFSKQNIEKKMTKIGTKLVSAEQREKIKQKTASLKFGMRKPRSSSDSQPPEASAKTEDSPTTEADVQVSPPGSAEQEDPFTDALAEPVPAEQQDVIKEEVGEEMEGVKEETKEVATESSVVVQADMSVVSEELSEEYALSATLPQEEKGAEEEKHDES